jgi:hypothetical protein
LERSSASYSSNVMTIGAANARRYIPIVFSNLPMRRALCAILLAVTLPVGAAAQRPRADLTGPFLYGGFAAGSVTAESGPIDANDTGYGWNAGAGFGVKPWFALVGDYVIFRATDAGARQYDVEQSAAGVRLRFGGTETSSVFLLEGGGAHRRTEFRTATVFSASPPPGAGDAVRVEGWAGWFGPAVQWYAFDSRVALEGAVAWAWGTFSHAKVNGASIALDDPVGITTLRFRIGVAATLF